MAQQYNAASVLSIMALTVALAVALVVALNALMAPDNKRRKADTAPTTTSSTATAARPPPQPVPHQRRDHEQPHVAPQPAVQPPAAPLPSDTAAVESPQAAPSTSADAAPRPATPPPPRELPASDADAPILVQIATERGLRPPQSAGSPKRAKRKKAAGGSPFVARVGDAVTDAAGLALIRHFVDMGFPVEAVTEAVAASPSRSLDDTFEWLLRLTGGVSDDGSSAAVPVDPSARSHPAAVVDAGASDDTLHAFTAVPASGASGNRGGGGDADWGTLPPLTIVVNAEQKPPRRSKAPKASPLLRPSPASPHSPVLFGSAASPPETPPMPLPSVSPSPTKVWHCQGGVRVSTSTLPPPPPPFPPACHLPVAAVASVASSYVDNDHALTALVATRLGPPHSPKQLSP